MRLGKSLYLSVIVLTIFLNKLTCGIYDLAWNPSGNYLAIPYENSYPAIYSFDKNINSLTYTNSQNSGGDIFALAWPGDGKYLAVGTLSSASNELQVFGVSDSGRLTGASLAGFNYNTNIYRVDWHPLITSGSTKYCLAVASAVPGVIGCDEFTIFQYDGASSLSVTDSRNLFGNGQRNNVRFHPTGNYIAFLLGYYASNVYDLQVFKFDAATRKIINGSAYAGKRIRNGTNFGGLCWSPDGRYLAVSGILSTNDIYIYRFYPDDALPFASRLQLVDSRNIGVPNFSILDWSSVGDYIAVSTDSPIGYELQIYQFDTKTEKLSTDYVFKYDFFGLIAIRWSPDSRYIALGAWNSDTFKTFWSYYKGLGLTRYDGTIYNVYKYKPIVLKSGDNAVGKVCFEGGITVANGTGVRLNVDLPISTFLDLRTTGSLELSGNLILDSKISLSSGGIIGLGDHSLILDGNLQIPDNAVLEFASSGMVDGQGHDVILGKYAQLLVDGGVTVTFKNMTIKNTLNTISCPPIRCMDWYSQVCFDNVAFAFSDDWAFRNGQFFVHNDVNFTGTSKFSYRSVRPSYIEQHSNLIFDPNTTFEYYPSSTTKSLIKMMDKTSSILFDGSTLQTTHTGVRFTNGSIYFDSQVTLSSADNTLTYSIGKRIFVDSNSYNTFSAAWSPDGKFLAVTVDNAANRLYKFGENTFTLLTTFGSNGRSLAWSPNGKYLVFGGAGVTSKVYSFDGTSLTYLSDVDSTTGSVASIVWSPDGKYLALSNYGTNCRYYRFKGRTFTLLGTIVSTNTYSIAWRSDGKYVVFGNNGETSKLYSFDGTTLTYLRDVDSTTYETISTAWSPDGNYLVLGNQAPSISKLYLFSGNTFSHICNFDTTYATRSVQWSPDGKYIAIGNDNNSGGVSQIYTFNGNSVTRLTFSALEGRTWSIAWSPDGKYLALGNYTGFGPSKVYQIYTKFDTSPQGFVNGVILGNSTIGASQDLDVYLLAAARVGIYGKVLQDSVNSSWNFQSRDSYVSLDRYDSQFKITNANSVENWKKNQIVKSSQDNTIFLQDNQIWATNMNQLAPEETFELMGNLNVSDNQCIRFSSDTIVDGNGYELTLGKYSQLLVEAGVTVTFKNMTIKNTLNTINTPPIRGAGFYNKICLDNVTFAFNDDWVFKNGQFFIHNDVNFTGTSRFIYSSPRPSYIVPHANLFFNPNTIFDYSPSSTYNNLINMQDKTSAIIFDGSTLLVTHTGIRLTKGSLYFDNKVTLSSSDNTISATLGSDITIASKATRGVAWSPDGKYLALGIKGQASEVYSFDGTSFTLLAQTSGAKDTYSIAWSPDGKYLALGNIFQASDIYSFDGIALSFVCSSDDSRATLSIAWSPDGKYVILGNNGQASEIYSFDGSSLTYISGADTPIFNTSSVDWHPSGQYFALGVAGGATSKVYSFNGTSILQVAQTLSIKDTRSIKWSPDGKYLALGNGLPSIVETSDIYYFSGTGLSLVAQTDETWYAGGVAWNSDGRYLAIGYNANGLESHRGAIYEFNGSSLSRVTETLNLRECYSVSWSPDGVYPFGQYITFGNGNQPTDTYPFLLSYGSYSTFSQSFLNSIIFGNSAVGTSQDLDVYLLGAARVGIHGKVWQDSVDSGFNFQSRDSYISLDRYDSKFKITNDASVQNWKKTQIIKSSAPNTLFLQDNQIWGTSLNQLAPEEAFEFMNNLIIPDNTLITFSSNSIIDGQSFDLIFGKRAQLFVDNGITVTLKNLNIKNTLNTRSTPIIRGLGATSKLCLDNVRFALNDDFSFNVGQMFVHNDVEFTGTSKFIYCSTMPSYIASHANLIFSPQTTFEYYPGSEDNSLIKMLDKTSSIFFDGCTLQTTHTGIRLTQGSIYFDNNVTLSSTIAIRPEQAFSNGIIFGNSTVGTSQDVEINILGRANIKIAGKVWFDDVN